jgi:hypothetical protein
MFHHCLLDYVRTPTMRILWTSRLIFQAGQTIVLVTTQPFITNGGADAEPEAQLTEIGVIDAR